MNRDTILKTLNIRYVDLKFTLLFPEDTTLPRYKVSALRGGMGQILLEQHCIRNGNCENCDFSKACVLQQTLYSQYEIQPAFAQKGNSIGYVLECSDIREKFWEGDRLQFHLLLFGKTIVYLYEFIQAFYWLGRRGIGKVHGQYDIINIKDQNGNLLLKSGNLYCRNMEVDIIRNYVLKREKEIFLQKSAERKLRFLSPVTIKYRGEFIHEFTKSALLESVMRRIYSFNCFEGIEMERISLEEEKFIIKEQRCFPRSEKRFSSTSGKPMLLRGSGGNITISALSETVLLALLAGEKMHIGKNTSFGFGKYIIV